jgi:prophage DNA circulation protein
MAFDTASFRGVPFRLNDAINSLGRRAQIHEFPGRDRPYVEDLGETARTYSLDGYVLGDDALVLRDRLIAASTQAGPGTLVHPTLGTFQVVCLSFEYREIKTGARRVDVRFGFIEAGDPPAPTATVATRDQVASAVTGVGDASLLDFLKQFDVNNLPNALLDALGLDLDDLVGTAAIYPWATGQAASLQRLLSGEWAADRAELLGTILGLSATAATDARSWEEGIAAAKALGAVPAAWAAPVQTTSTRATQAAGQTALATAVRVASGAAAGSVAEATDPTSRDEARFLRTAALALIDDAVEAAAAAGWDDTYVALSRLRAAVVDDLAARGADLSPLVRVVPAGPVPSLTLAQRMYADIGAGGVRASDVAIRARAAHPAFLTGPMDLLAS